MESLTHLSTYASVCSIRRITAQAISLRKDKVCIGASEEFVRMLSGNLPSLRAPDDRDCRSEWQFFIIAMASLWNSVAAESQPWREFWSNVADDDIVGLYDDHQWTTSLVVWKSSALDLLDENISPLACLSSAMASASGLSDRALEILRLGENGYWTLGAMLYLRACVHGRQ
jgi:hypothetical protein